MQAIQLQRSIIALGAIVALTACGGSDDDVSAPPTPTLTPFERHMEASRLNAGGDPRMLNPWRAFYCNLPDDNNAIVLNERQKNSIRVPLTQIMDDIWFIGTEYVGQYILRNQDGFVMIDGGNRAAEILEYNLPALESLGWSQSNPLHAVLLTHGHGDHDGGAAQLKQSTNAALYLGSADAAGKAYDPVLLDSDRMEPYTLSVGGRDITVLSTPGHTAGATGFVVTGLDGGKPVKLFVSGGSSMSQTSLPLIRSYLESMERTYQLLKETRVDTASNPHIYWDGSRDLIYQIQNEGLKSPSQFIIGNDKLLRAMAIGRECTAAWLAQKDPESNVPSWRVSEIDFVAGSPSSSMLSAKLNNGWGPVANQSVSFFVDGTTPLCTAKTNQAGIASCTPPQALRAGVDHITAQFDGASQDMVVELGSTVTAAAR